VSTGVAWCALGACGDNIGVLADAPAEALPFHSAPHVQLPTISDHAQMVLAQVQLVTVTFEDDPARPVAEAFGDAAPRSAWYATVGAEYRVSVPAESKAPQRLRLGPAPAMVDRATIAELVPATPLADPDVLYLIYIPPTVGRAPELIGVAGYHAVVRRGELEIPYAVVLDNNLVRDPAALTTNAGRQLINAVTNPFPAPRDGYYLDALAIDPWSLVVGGPADLCVHESPVVDQGITYPLIYSNAFALEGFPCKPGRPDDPWSDVTAKPAQLPKVARDSTITFVLTGWSTQPAADWQLETRASERSAFTKEQMQPVFSEDAINNGRSVTLTLHVPPDAASDLAGGVYVLSGVNRHPWAVGFIVR